MPNANPNAITWSTEEFEKLVDLMRSHPFLYNVEDTSRKNILARESTWEQISQELNKPVEDCKKRWTTLRDGYMKTFRNGSIGKTKIGIFKKLDFLNDIEEQNFEKEEDVLLLETKQEETTEQEVVMDNQEYYEITLVDSAQESQLKVYQGKPPQNLMEEPPKKVGRKNCGRKRSVPCPTGLPPIKILPKPVMLNGPKIIHYMEEPKVSTPSPMPAPSAPQPQRSEVLDSLIEKVLKEHTNEIDVFFRSMAASVKKLQPNLIPKVKMEVCNVIAKYEMQSFDKNGSGY